jgi:DNA-binding MarR family transcriptional regulator
VPKDLNTNLRFGFLVHDVSRLRRVVIDRSLKPIGITRSQWWVLAFLSRRDGMTQTALAADLDLTKVAVGGLLDRLDAAGFTERRADKRDGRAKRIYLTPAGVKIISTIRRNVEKTEEAILASVSNKELEITAQTLVTIKRTLLAMLGGEQAEPEDAELLVF